MNTYWGVWCHQGECVSCGQDELNCAQLGIDADEYPSRSRTAVSFYSSTASTAPFCRERETFQSFCNCSEIKSSSVMRKVEPLHFVERERGL